MKYLVIILTTTLCCQLASAMTRPAATSTPAKIAVIESAKDEAITDACIDGKFVYLVKHKGSFRVDDDREMLVMVEGVVVVEKYDALSGQKLATTKPQSYDEKLDSKRWNRVLVPADGKHVVLSGRQPTVYRSDDLKEVVFPSRDQFAGVADASWTVVENQLVAVTKDTAVICNIDGQEAKAKIEPCDGYFDEYAKLFTQVRTREVKAFGNDSIMFRVAGGLSRWSLKHKAADRPFAPMAGFDYWDVSPTGDIVMGEASRRGLKRAPFRAQSLVWLDGRDKRYRYVELPESLSLGLAEGAALLNRTNGQVVLFSGSQLMHFSLLDAKVLNEWKATFNIKDILLSSDDRYLIVRGDDCIEVWDLGVKPAA